MNSIKWNNAKFKWINCCTDFDRMKREIQPVEVKIILVYSHWLTSRTALKKLELDLKTRTQTFMSIMCVRDLTFENLKGVTVQEIKIKQRKIIHKESFKVLPAKKKSYKQIGINNHGRNKPGNGIISPIGGPNQKDQKGKLCPFLKYLQWEINLMSVLEAPKSKKKFPLFGIIKGFLKFSPSFQISWLRPRICWINSSKYSGAHTPINKDPQRTLAVKLFLSWNFLYVLTLLLIVSRSVNSITTGFFKVFWDWREPLEACHLRL